MLFYQIYDKLQNLDVKHSNLEEILMETFKIARQNRKREEKLYERVCLLEETNKKLLEEIKHMALKQEKDEEKVEIYKEQNNELTYKHNMMITTINSIIAELNNVVFVLNNKYQENYYVLRVLCKKSFNRGFEKHRILKMYCKAQVFSNGEFWKIRKN